MGLTIGQAWKKAARLMAHAAGYGHAGDVNIRKVKEDCNDTIGVHVITLELVIKDRILTPIGKPLGEQAAPSFIQHLLSEPEA